MAIRPKVLVFDLDGTLAESKQRMSAATGNLLAELLQKMPVAVMSGAGLPQLEKQFLSALPADAALGELYLFPTNAAACYVYRNNTWHPYYNNALSDAEKDRIRDMLEAALKEVGLFDPPAQVWGERIEDRISQISFSGLGQEAPITAKKAWDPSGEKRRTLRDALAAKLPECSVSMSGSTTIDITQSGINKAYGIKRLADITDIAIPHMLYVGDALEEGGNDAVVLETGVPTHAVFSPQETATLIEDILHTYHSA